MVAGVVGSFGYDSVFIAGQINESFFKEVYQTDRIVAGNFGQNSSGFRTAVFVSIVCHNGALERIDEASTEIIVVTGSYLDVGAGAADSRSFGIFEAVTGCDGEAGAPAA